MRCEHFPIDIGTACSQCGNGAVGDSGAVLIQRHQTSATLATMGSSLSVAGEGWCE